jgi:hypothetical protein
MVAGDGKGFSKTMVDDDDKWPPMMAMNSGR